MLKIRKGPFHPDTLAQSNAETSHNSLAGKRGDLKAGRRMGAVSPILLAALDTEHVRWGKYCLWISGQAGKQNVCAARAIIQCAARPIPWKTCWQWRARAGNVFLQGAGPRIKVDLLQLGSFRTGEGREICGV